MKGGNRFTSRGKLVDDGDVEIAVETLPLRSPFVGSRLAQDMWVDGVLLPLAGSLCYSEAMLFVDNDQSDIPESDHIFE